MNTRSLRFRLVTWYAAWLAVVFGMAGVLLYFGLRHYLELNLARLQAQRAERVSTLLARVDFKAPSAERNLAEEITTRYAPEASGRFIRITRDDGATLYRSGPPDDQSFKPELIPPANGRLGTRKETLADGTELLLATRRAGPSDGPRFFIETGESLAPALNELGRLLTSLALGLAVVAAVALGGGFLLVQQALQPVDKITRSAERITSHNLSERLPAPATGDEFENLSRALNRMITRLDEAFQHNHRFLADASHELRTPLTILRGELEGMVRRDDLSPESRETIANLLEETERLTRLVENLFALSRLDAGQAHVEHARFDLARLVALTAEQMCLLVEDKGLCITCRAPAPVFVEGDRARLKQVVVNLLDNAIKYTQRGGRISLSVATAHDEAVFEVSDTGIGIPAEAIPRVFDRFFRVDQARSRELGGAGIGLSIVKAICASHRGVVEVESEEAGGSRFRVRLPMATSAPDPEPALHEN